MRIDELDEFQGVTPQLVTGWLLANGWTQTKPRWWERGEDGFLFDSETFDSLWFWTYALAAIYTAGNVQQLLCKINPRMRKGTPSEAARAAHMKLGGLWVQSYGTQLVKIINDCGPFFVTLDNDGDETRWESVFVDRASFWPCDEHGNKVRWPTSADGEML